MTLVMGGLNATMIQASGLLAAHLYDFLTRIYPAFGGGRNYIVTPEFVRRWFAGPAGRRGPTTRSYGTAFIPDTAARAGTQQRAQQQPARAASGGLGGGFASGFASGVSGLWNNRGPGRRLGGD